MVKERNEINKDLQWDLKTIFETDSDFVNELGLVNDRFDKVEQKYKGHLLDSANSLLEITSEMLSISRKVEKIYVYASMKNDQDTRLAQYQEYQAKATALYAKFGEAFAFYDPEFMALTNDEYQQFLVEEPQLRQYAHLFERLFFHARPIRSLKKKKNYWLALQKFLAQQLKHLKF